MPVTTAASERTFSCLRGLPYEHYDRHIGSNNRIVSNSVSRLFIKTLKLKQRYFLGNLTE